MSAMSTKSREVIWGGQIMGAEIHAKHAREEARKAAREGGSRRGSRMVVADGRLWWPSAALTNHRPMPQRRPRLARSRMQSLQDTREPAAGRIRRPRETPLWNLEPSLKCRSCRQGRYAPPVHMIKLTETREITPYKWVHPDEER